MSLRDLYQEIIIDHGKTPRNFGKLASPTHAKAGKNPLCGDEIMIYVSTNNHCLEDIKFEGKGCAICIASTSLMIESIKGKFIDDFKKLFEQFHTLLTVGETEETSLGKLSALSGVAEFPVRVKCATLAWHTLRAALMNDTHPVTTEIGG